MRKRLNAGSTSAESAHAFTEGPQSFLAARAVQPPSVTSVPGTHPTAATPGAALALSADIRQRRPGGRRCRARLARLRIGQRFAIPMILLRADEVFE
jgi:hypothetical protein